MVEVTSLKVETILLEVDVALLLEVEISLPGVKVDLLEGEGTLLEVTIRSTLWSPSSRLLSLRSLSGQPCSFWFNYSVRLSSWRYF